MRRLSIVIFILSLIITGCANDNPTANHQDIKPTSTSSQTSNNNTYELPETTLSFKDAITFKASEDTNMALYKAKDTNNEEYYGFINTKTGEIIAPVFKDYSNSLSIFSWGLEPVMIDEKWGYLSSTGKMMTDTIYDSASEFVAGHAIVEQYGTFGIVDSRFVNKVALQYSSIYYDPSTGYVLKSKAQDGQRFGYFSTDTNFIVKPIYKDPLVFKGNYAIAFDPRYEKYEIVSRQGNVIASVLEEITFAFMVNESNYYSYTKDGLYGIIKVSGNTFEYVTEAIYDHLVPYEDAFTYTHNDEEGIVLTTGETIKCSISTIKDLGSTKQDYIRIVGDDQSHFIDKEGQHYLTGQFLEATDVNGQNYTVASKDNKQYVINMDGTIIYETEGMQARLLSDTLIAFTDSKAGTTLIYDTNNQAVITEGLEMVYSEADHIEGLSENGVTLVSLEGKLLLGPIKGYKKDEYSNGYLMHMDHEKNYYLTDLNNQILSDDKYTQISLPNEDGYRQVRQGYRAGIANEDGSISIPCIYQYAYPLTNKRALVIDNFDETPKVDIIQMP